MPPSRRRPDQVLVNQLDTSVSLSKRKQTLFKSAGDPGLKSGVRMARRIDINLGSPIRAEIPLQSGFDLLGNRAQELPTELLPTELRHDVDVFESDEDADSPSRAFLRNAIRDESRDLA